MNELLIFFVLVFVLVHENNTVYYSYIHMTIVCSLSLESESAVDIGHYGYCYQESRAVVRKPHDATAVLFGLKFADNIHYKFKGSQASKAVLKSSKHRHKTEFNAKCLFKVIQDHVFGVSGKAIRDLSSTKY